MEQVIRESKTRRITKIRITCGLNGSNLCCIYRYRPNQGNIGRYHWSAIVSKKSFDRLLNVAAKKCKFMSVGASSYVVGDYDVIFVF